MKNQACFLSLSPHWATPKALYEELDREFAFNFDPCPLSDNGIEGLMSDWTGRRVFCNPPYGPGIKDWLTKGLDADVAVFLIPSRTDVRWFHEIVLPRAQEIRFIKGRLKFGDATASAPFPSMVCVFRRATHAQEDPKP